MFSNKIKFIYSKKISVTKTGSLSFFVVKKIMKKSIYFIS